MQHFNTICTICNILLCFLLCSHLSSCALFYPTNSAYGIFAAIAVPLDLPHRNVFISYNFEANYNLPATWGLPPIAAGSEDEDLFEAGRHIKANECANCTLTEDEENSSLYNTTTKVKPSRNGTTENTEEKENERHRRSLLTRTHFYHILKDKFERSGYNGESCLLRLICETNASGLGDINGVLGTLVHIIFSPSTSLSETLPLHYYQAEIDGVHEQCEHYVEECQENLLDLISRPLDDIINSLTNRE